MAIKKSISGMRGTIGGAVGENLTPIDIVEMTAAYAAWILNQNVPKKVVVGRDGRISGAMVSNLASQTLISMGLDVIDYGLSTTPTIEMAVKFENAGGGIIFTASHNPREWNALKLLNEKGEFLSQKDGDWILDKASKRDFNFATIDNVGSLEQSDKGFDEHIQAIIDLPYINLEKIRSKGFKVVVDCINSTGALALPPLFEKLACSYTLLNAEVTGEFAHNPEPVPAHLTDLSQKIKDVGADVGIAVDPDVDRLVLVCEDGSMFSEEYTIVAASDFLLSHKKGPTVSNLSSSRALSDISKMHNQPYYAAAVGEVNVVEKMKAVNAVIGGEGNGGVILPDLHYGRDALVGIAMILNHLADKNLTLSQLKASYPEYVIIKQKLEIGKEIKVSDILNQVKNQYLSERLDETDGLKIDFENGWVHLRESNTEPIIRIIAEAKTSEEAEHLIKPILKQIDENFS